MILKSLNKWQYIFLSLLLFATSCKPNYYIIEIKPSKNIIVTDSGSNKVTLKNPYAKSKSIAIVTNIGEHNLSVRIESNGTKIKRATIQPNETKEIELLRGQQLYFDSYKKTKAKVRFKGIAKYF